MPTATARQIELGGRTVNMQISEGGGSADITFTAGESPDSRYLDQLKYAVEGYGRTLQNEGYLVLVRRNDHAVSLRIGDVSSAARLENITKLLYSGIELAWSRKPMAHAATASGNGTNTS